MNIVYLGDEPSRAIQEQQLEVLSERDLQVAPLFWNTADLAVFEQLDQQADGNPLLLIGSRLGAIPAIHWTARNPHSVRRLVLLHPALHLNLPGEDAPKPHFVPTMIVHHSKEGNPRFEEVPPLAGAMFCDYALHLTPEPPSLRSTLSLMAL